MRALLGSVSFPEAVGVGYEGGGEEFPILRVQELSNYLYTMQPPKLLAQLLLYAFWCSVWCLTALQECANTYFVVPYGLRTISYIMI